MNKQYSNEFKNKEKLIAFTKVDLRKRRSLWALALSNGLDDNLRAKFPNLKTNSKKITWREKVLKNLTFELNASIPANTISETPTNITWPSTKGIKSTHVLTPMWADWKAITDLNILVLETVDSNTLSVVTLGWDTSIEIPANAILTVSWTANQEWTSQKPTGLETSVEMYNHTRIIKWSSIVTWTSVVVVDWQKEFGQDIKRELYEDAYRQYADWIHAACSSWMRSKYSYEMKWRDWDLVTQEVRNMGGVPYFAFREFDSDWNEVTWTADTTDNVYDAGWVAISEDIINNQLTQLHIRRWRVNAVLCHPERAQELSAFRKDDTRIVVVNWDSTNTKTIWWKLERIESSVDDTFIDTIYVDSSLPVDEIYFFYEPNIALVFMEWREALYHEEFANGKDDWDAIYFTSEASLVHLNAQRDSIKIKNLAV